MNSVLLVGRLTRTPELFSTETGKKGSYITLAINRSYKNIDGEYETDYLDCTLWTNIAESAVQYCRKGDTVGVRGKLQTRIIENSDGTKTKKVDIIADRVSFISSKPNDSYDNVSVEAAEKEQVEESTKETTEYESKKKKNNS